MTTLFKMIANAVANEWDDDCWIWEGYTNDKGYGKVYSPLVKKPVRVHVLAYEFRYGKVPNNKELDHIRCSTRNCWNPEHVIPVFHEDNIARAQLEGKYANNGPHRWNGK